MCMTEGGKSDPIAELVGSFVETWLKIRRIDRTTNLAIARQTTWTIALASSWLGISWGLFVAYTVGKERIEEWQFAALFAMIILTNISFLYLVPKLLDHFSEEVISASDAAIAIAFKQRFHTEASVTTSSPLAPPEAPQPESNSPQKRP